MQIEESIKRQKKAFVPELGGRLEAVQQLCFSFLPFADISVFQQMKVKWFFEVLLGCSINSDYARWPMKMGSLAPSDLLHILHPDPTLLINCYFFSPSVLSVSSLTSVHPLHDRASTFYLMNGVMVCMDKLSSCQTQ